MSNIRETIKNVVSVLLEGRLEDVKAKYDENMSNIIDNLSHGDPSGNNKYLDWMAKAYKVFPHTSEILKIVKAYHENLMRLTSDISKPIVDSNKSSFPGRAERRVKNNPKDITGYPSLAALKLVVDVLEETRKERPDRDSIYQDDRWTVIVPKTHEAACKYGVHSNWCVSTSNNDYFKQYTSDKDALLFFILWRSKNNVGDKTEYKVAINAEFQDWENPKDWDWYDMPDSNMDPNLMLNVFPKVMIDKIQKYLISEGKRQGKIVNGDSLLKLVDENLVYSYGEVDNTLYFSTDSLGVFSNLPNYTRAMRWHSVGELNSMNSYVRINKTNGYFEIIEYSVDLWGGPGSEWDEASASYVDIPPALSAYKSWKRGTRYDFVNYVLNIKVDGLTIPEELKQRIHTKATEDLTRIGGIWVDTRTTSINIGDRIRWKKGRGYWQQRGANWNDTTIDRETPSGFLVTGKTDDFPKGKRFKPSNNTRMEVWNDFGNTINFKAKDMSGNY